MSEGNVYAITEIVGTSPDTIEDAIRVAVDRASKTVRNLDWFVVTETRGHLSHDGSIEQFQVTIKLGFRMED
jgi:dodecin